MKRNQSWFLWRMCGGLFAQISLAIMVASTKWGQDLKSFWLGIGAGMAAFLIGAACGAIIGSDR